MISELNKWTKRFVNGLVATGGTKQVETAVAVGTVTTAGNAHATVTSALMPSSPKLIKFAVAVSDDASAIGAKARAALTADDETSNFYVVSGSGANVVLTARAAAANDSTLNVAIENGTCAGITDDTSSNNTTAGVAGTAQTIEFLKDEVGKDQQRETIVKVSPAGTFYACVVKEDGSHYSGQLTSFD